MAGNNSRNSRISNTNNEVIFLANCYYDQLVVIKTYEDDATIEYINSKFSWLAEELVAKHKVKRESYNKFKKIFADLNIASVIGSKEIFINTVMNAINARELEDRKIDSMMITSMYNDFSDVMSKYDLGFSKKYINIMFVCMIKMICEGKGFDSSIINELENKFKFSGQIDWRTPIVLVASDGCSHSVYGSAMKHIDKC